MATAMGAVAGVTITAHRNGVAIMMGMEGTDLGIRTPITTHNQSMYRSQCTICHSSHLASVCFCRLIFVYRGSVAKFDFCGEIEKLSPINSISYVVTNS
jgi:hypothetical protein